jgi:miniconductance mechanosensitive channel
MSQATQAVAAANDPATQAATTPEVTGVSSFTPDLTSVWEYLDWAYATSPLLTQVGLIVILVVASLPVQYLARLLLVRFGGKISSKTKSNLDDLMVEHRVPNHLSHLVPAAFVLYAVDALTPYFSATVWAIVVNVTNGIMALAVTAALAAVVAVVQTRLMTTRYANRLGLKGYAQIIKLIIYLIGGIITVSLFIGQDPSVLIGSLAGMTAILMLVFKDTILGFVASIKIATEDLIRPGDWIEIPGSSIDGDVIDMTVNTIKVQNWDKTIATVPTSAILTGSFKNWRGMQDSGGRRIKRSIHLDMSTIGFLSDEQVATLSQWELLEDYLAAKNADITSWQTSHHSDAPVPFSRRLTNVGTFRAYISSYLRSQSTIHQTGMTFLIRQLQPGAQGLPIEIYVFTTTTNWVEYEGIQADVFDHLLAIAPEFGLRVFQEPTGADWRQHISTGSSAQ